MYTHIHKKKLQKSLDQENLFVNSEDEIDSNS